MNFDIGDEVFVDNPSDHIVGKIVDAKVYEYHEDDPPYIIDVGDNQFYCREAKDLFPYIRLSAKEALDTLEHIMEEVWGD